MKYDNKTKKLVLKKFESGGKICKIAKDFGINRSTISIWKQLYNQDLEAKDSEFSKFFEIKISDRTHTQIYDRVEIKKFIDEKPDCTHKEIIEKFQCSKGFVTKILKILSYIRKKNGLHTKSKIL